MAKAKTTRRKASLANRLINAGLFAFAFYPFIRMALRVATGRASMTDFTSLVTAGASVGQFDINNIMAAYGPTIGAFILFELKKMAMRKFRF